MRRLLIVLLGPLLSLQACDRLAAGVKNDTQHPLSVQFIFRADAECKTYEPIVLSPGQGTATRCLPDDIKFVRISEGQKNCDVAGEELGGYYKSHELGSAYPISGC